MSISIPQPVQASLWPRAVTRRSACLGMFLLVLLAMAALPARAYSVLTHEQIIDIAWQEKLRPMLLARFPNASADDLKTAHAYAYGGSLIQDIGYYPFGSKLFSNLVHYVRSGDFVTSLIDESLKSQDINEYAFALGALAHYASDIAGHPAVNAAVAIDFPKLRAKYGDSVTYEDDPKAHIRTEFGFDVSQVARGHFTSDAYHDFIGFEVSRPLLERAFLATYGLKLTDIVADPDLSIGSFRFCVSGLIPQMTKVAIVMNKDDIAQRNPGMTPSEVRRKYEYHLSRTQYQRDFGKNYRRPSFGVRLLAFFLRILPHIGPLRTLDIKVPSPQTETLYVASVVNSTNRYESDLGSVGVHSLMLENKDFDTGRKTTAGEYGLTDETYSDLLDRLSKDHFANINAALRANILDYYRDPKPPAFARHHRSRWSKTLANLETLKSMPATPAGAASAEN